MEDLRRLIANLLCVAVAFTGTACSSPMKAQDGSKAPSTGNTRTSQFGAENKSSATSLVTAGITQNDQHGTVTVGGLQRTYLLHMPAAFDKSVKRPLVIVLHGGGGAGRGMNALTNFNSLSDKEGFVVAYPDGVDHNWNDGRGVPDIWAQAHDVDDVGFIGAVINRLEEDLNIDRTMVYATGISNGAMMSYRLGAQLADKIAAIAPVAGNIPESTYSSWVPSRAVSVMAINGTADPLMPFVGGDVMAILQTSGRVVSVADSVKFWVSKDGCPSAPRIRELPHIHANDPTSTTVENYEGCRDKTEVILYMVKDGGHTWPGGPQYMQESLIGKTSRDFSATETIWQFFKAHPLPKY